MLSSDFSARAAATVMGRLAKLSARFIGERGFSIGIDDVTPAPLLDRRKRDTISSSYAECQVTPYHWRDSTNTNSPGLE